MHDKYNCSNTRSTSMNLRSEHESAMQLLVVWASDTACDPDVPLDEFEHYDD